MSRNYSLLTYLKTRKKREIEFYYISAQTNTLSILIFAPFSFVSSLFFFTSFPLRDRYCHSLELDFGNDY